MAIKKVGRENYAYYGKYKKYDGTYKNYYKSGYRTKKEASRSEEAFLLGIKNCDNEITFGELVDMFNERSISMNIKESTIVGYESYYKNHLEYYFSKKKVSKITPQEIELWNMDMIKKKKHDGNTYSSSTINHAKNVLSKYLSYASQLGIIQYNPCNKVSKYTNPDEIIRKRNDDENFWEIDEFRKFIDSVDDPYWNLVFTFLFETGMREGELFALTWNDIDFKNQTISINKSITSKTHQNTFKVTTPKNINSYRTIDMSSTLFNRIFTHLEKQKRKDGYCTDYYVFGDVTPLSRSHMARYLDKYIEMSKVKRITPHGFRHSHATFLIQNSIDDSLIADRLGHTVNELRKTYAHIYKSMHNDMRTKLDDLYY